MDNQMNETEQMEKKHLHLQVSDIGEDRMLSIARWIKFIAVIALIFWALMFFIAIGIITTGGLRHLTGPGIIYLIVVAIYFYLLIKTFDVSKHFHNAVFETDDHELEMGLIDMRRLVTCFVILTILGLVMIFMSIISGVFQPSDFKFHLDDDGIYLHYLKYFD